MTDEHQLQDGRTVLTVVTQPVGDWPILATVYSGESRRISVLVRATIGNSVPTSEAGRANLLNWKRQVAAAAKGTRMGQPLDARQAYAVSVGFSFHPLAHGNRSLDIENFLKPTFDGLAAGLFCDSLTDCALLERFAYDDSGFRYLFAHRLPDAASAREEGAGIVVSIPG